MDPLLSAMALAGIAGLSMPLGAALARLTEHRLHPPTLNFITALGAGALLAAVAFVLVPKGIAALPGSLSVALLLAGGLAFYLADRAIAAHGGAGSQLVAMLLDFLPEAAALGALFVVDPATSVLLAGLIFLQNLPEGFASFREIEDKAHVPAGRVIALFLALALMGPLCAALGLVVLSGEPAVLGAVMLLSSGGILYLVFQDIAPESRLPDDGRPALGAAIGFALGLAGRLLAG